MTTGSTSRNGGGTFPRVQLITVADALDGKRIEYPSHITSTFKEAPKVEEDEGPPQEEQLFGFD